MSFFERPRLIADIGNLYARFALELSLGVFDHAVSLRCADHADFHAAVSAYLGALPDLVIHHAAIAIANPVDGDQVRMTNYHWQFSIEHMRERLKLDTLVVVNDFTALAMAVPRLAPDEVRQVGAGMARPRGVVGLLGPGTGLGMSGLIPTGDGWISLGSEGGHASFSPRDEREMRILRHAWRQFPHVSIERLLSSAGLALIHQALSEGAGGEREALAAPEITRRALLGVDPVCVEALEVFCGLLGTAAADLAVTLGALGGIYIGGGIVPRLGPWLERSPFRSRFADKGRLSSYLAGIATFVITSKRATFVGASAILEAQLGALRASSGSAILSQIKRSRSALSPAEMRVADQVLSHPRSVLNAPVVDIARAAGVSQPTVIRFCRSVGCDGLSDFKLRLASGLTNTIPLTHTQVTNDDTMLELGAKVLGNTASAILQVRDQLNRDSIDQAIDLLVGADRIDFYAVGHYGVVAQDAQFKFLRFGVSSASYTDVRLQLFAANVLRANDVAVVISNSGRVAELIAVVDKAHERGARVIAITASQSTLARKADVALHVDHVEDVVTHLPMVSRILHLLVIDILAVGVAMRRNPAGLEAPADAAEAGLEAASGQVPPATRRKRKTVQQTDAIADGSLARLTSHSR